VCLDTQIRCKRIPCLAESDGRKDRQERIIELSFAESVIVRKTWDGSYKLKERTSGDYLGAEIA
jgi:hypothetical protein